MTPLAPFSLAWVVLISLTCTAAQLIPRLCYYSLIFRGSVKIELRGTDASWSVRSGTPFLPAEKRIAIELRTLDRELKASIEVSQGRIYARDL